MKDATTVLQSSGAGLKLLLLSLAIVTQTYAQESMRDRVQNETGPLMLQKKAQSREYQGREVEGEDRRIGPGDSIWRILVKEKGLSENRFSQYLVIIRGLNPKISNIDVLKVGDTISFHCVPMSYLQRQRCWRKQMSSARPLPGEQSKSIA